MYIQEMLLTFTVVPYIFTKSCYVQSVILIREDGKIAIGYLPIVIKFHYSLNLRYMEDTLINIYKSLPENLNK